MNAASTVPELSMDLDSIISQSKKSGAFSSRRRGKGGRANFNRGAAITRAISTEQRPFIRQFAASNRTAGKRTVTREAAAQPEHRQATGGLATTRRQNVIGAGTGAAKVVVSNLDFGVTEDDLWEIFTRCGEVRKIQLNFDCYGQSTGTAVVHYDRQVDALKSIEEFHNVPLDSRRMNLELSISPSKLQPSQAQLPIKKVLRGEKIIKFGNRLENLRPAKSNLSLTGNRNESFRGRQRRGGRGGRGGSNSGLRRSRNGNGTKSLSDLDVDLDAYMAQRSAPAAGLEKMQTD